MPVMDLKFPAAVWAGSAVDLGKRDDIAWLQRRYSLVVVPYGDCHMKLVG